MSQREEAEAYLTLLSFFNGDEEKAWIEYQRVKKEDIPFFVSYAKKITSSDTEENRFTQIWREVRDSFENEKIPFTVIGENSEYFPFNSEQTNVHFLYCGGKIELLKKKKIVVLGSSMPSLKAKEDALLAVDEIIKSGAVLLSPLDNGIGAFALSVAIKRGGDAIAMLSSSLSKCPNEALLPLMGEIYEKGLLLTQFPPLVKREKWHVVLRNRFLSSLGDGFFLTEEKNGGPSWPIFDKAMEEGKRCMVPYSLLDNPNYSWFKKRVECGALVYKKPKDIKKLIGSEKEKKKAKSEEEGDLFSSLFT